MYCTKCGKEIADNISFCPFCGNEIEASEISKKISLEKNDSGYTGHEEAVNNNGSTSSRENNTGFYKEYHFKSQVKGKSVEVGPITLAEGYSTRTDIIVDDDKMSFSQSRFMRKSKDSQIQIADIKSIESGAFFPVWFLIIIALVVGVGAFTSIAVGTSPFLRVGIVAFIIIMSILEVKNVRANIIHKGGRLFFDSRDKENVEAFKTDMSSHPKYAGSVGKSGFLVQKIIIALILLCSVVMIIKPNPFAGSQLFEGSYQEWEEARYPQNYRTFILADITFGIDDTENDSILVLAGDNFDKEIWITNNSGQKIRDWKWLHDATPVEDNIAIFEITLTHYKNEDNPLNEETFVFTDPVAISYENYAAKTGQVLDSDKVEQIEEPEDNKSTGNELASEQAEENIAKAVDITNSSGDYTEYLDWCGAYEGGWMDTDMWFGLYTDGTQDPECGYIELNFRGNEYRGNLYYQGGNKFYAEIEYASSTEGNYLYPKYSNGKYTIDIYTAEGDYDCTYTMYMSYDEYVESESQFGYASEYIVDGSDSGYFDKSYFENMSDEELRLARNEILARHGRTFKDQSLQDYFNSKSWYTPMYTPEEFDAQMEQILNGWEKANIETIKEVEADRK